MFVAHLLPLNQLCSLQEAGSPARMAGSTTAGTRPELAIAPQCDRLQGAGPPARTAGGTATGTRPALVTAVQRERLAAAARDSQQPLSPALPRPVAMPVDPSLQRRRSPPPPSPFPRGGVPPFSRARLTMQVQVLLSIAHSDEAMWRPSAATSTPASTSRRSNDSDWTAARPESVPAEGHGGTIAPIMHPRHALSPSLWASRASLQAISLCTRGRQFRSDNPGRGSVVPGRGRMHDSCSWCVMRDARTCRRP